jgi:hypothetical protein
MRAPARDWPDPAASRGISGAGRDQRRLRLLVNKARDDTPGWSTPSRCENQINALLLEIRRAESAARGYLLTPGRNSWRITSSRRHHPGTRQAAR